MTDSGPEEEELDGLNLEEHKHRRSEAHGLYSHVNDDNITMEAVISSKDCTASLIEQMATLAK